MKLKNIIYGMMCVVTLGSCSDKMEYHEYNNYDEDFVKLNFGNVGGLITNIYLSMDVDFGNYSGAILGSATDESEYAYSGNQIEDFYNGSWSPSNAKSSMWTSCYEGIANCNLYLEKFTGLTFPELALNSDYAHKCSVIPITSMRCVSFVHISTLTWYGNMEMCRLATIY